VQRILALANAPASNLMGQLKTISEAAGGEEAPVGSAEPEAEAGS